MTERPTGLLKNRYIIGDVIGQGGMASVHVAHDTSLGRDVAVKLFPPTTDEAALKRSEDEVNVLATLSHHGLVTLLDAGVHRAGGEQRVFLVMELVKGTDLQRMVATERLVSRQIAYIGYDLAEALQYIHHLGVVHRDVKPSNVLFVDYSDNSTRARVKLTDFGIAYRGIERAAPDTITTGTAAYLSPEQVRRDEVGPPTDIYSLGLVLLECFTGSIAFPGDPAASALARLETNPEVPRDLPPEWRGLLAAMTARDPAERPVAAELVLALRDLIIMEVGRHTSEATVQAARPITMRTRRSDRREETSLDALTALAARMLSTPIAILAASDSGREWFKAKHGIDLAQIEAESGRQSSAVVYQEQWEPEDTTTDPRVLADPAIAAQFGMKFHASTPVVARDGTSLGVLCVMDVDARALTEADTAILQNLAAIAMRELERRIAEYLADKPSIPAEAPSSLAEA